MATPYEIALGRQSTPGGVRGLANPLVRNVLEESESPGTFEQFFRFLGRPGFAARSALSGDLEGVGRNVGQFLNEIFLGGLGALNPNWTLTGAIDMLTPFDLPKDFTEKKHRPEFTDLLKRWGVADPRYMSFGEKLALDIVGGGFTDPLSLVGGAPKGVTAASLKAAGGRFQAQRAAFAGIRSGGGKALNQSLDLAINTHIREEAAKLLSPGKLRVDPKKIREGNRVLPGMRDGAFRAEDAVAQAQNALDESGRRMLAAREARRVNPHPTPADRAALQEMERRHADALAEVEVARRNLETRHLETQEGFQQAEDFYEELQTGIQDAYVRMDNDRWAALEAVDAHYFDLQNAGPPPGQALHPFLANLENQRIAAREAAEQFHAEQFHTAFASNDDMYHVGWQSRVQAEDAADEAYEAFLRGPVDQQEAARASGHSFARSAADIAHQSDAARQADAAFQAARQADAEAVVAFGPTSEQARAARAARAALVEAEARLTAQTPRGAGNVRGISKLPMGHALAQFNHTNLHDFVKRAPEFGISQKRASQIVIGIENRAAETLFFENAAKAGVDLRGAQRTLKPGNIPEELNAFFNKKDSTKFLMQVDQWDPAFPNATARTPDILRAGERSGELMSIRVQTAGLPQEIFFKPIHEMHALTLAKKHESLVLSMSGAGAPPEVLARLHRDIGMLQGHSDDAIRETLTALGLPTDVVTGAEQAKRFLDELPHTVIDDGIKALQAKGMTGDGISYFNPFKGEWKSMQWSSLAQLTLPGQAAGLLRMTERGTRVADQIGEWVNGVAGVVMNRIFDRFSPTGGVDPAFSPKVRRRVYQAYVNAAAHADTARRMFLEKLSPEERGLITKMLDVESDVYHAAIHEGQHLTPEILSVVKQRIVEMGIKENDLFDISGALNPLNATVDRMAARLYADGNIENVRRGIRQLLPGREEDGLKALDAWQGAMSEIPDYMRYQAKSEKQLKDFSPAAKAAWKQAIDNPFYVPHQISRRLHAALDEGLFDKNLATKINDVFSGQKKYRSRKQFLEALEGLATDIGMDLDDSVEDALQNLDMAELYYRRMASFELTKARQGIYQDAERLMAIPSKGGLKSDYEFYINRVLHPTAALDPFTGAVKSGGGARKNFFAKLLGGGRFTVPLQSAAQAQGIAHRLQSWGGKAIVHEGSHGVTFRFPGINSWYKPLLTSHPLNPKFVVRNIMSSALMMQFISGIGPEGFKQIAPALMNHGMVRTLLKLRGDPKQAAARALLGPSTAMELSAGDYVSAWTRFLVGNTQAERDAALDFLKRSGVTVGAYSIDQVAPALRMVMGAGGGVNPSDLSSGTDLIQKMMPDIMSLSLATRADAAKISKARQGLRDYIAHGERLSNEVEARFRATAMLELLARGVDPHEAARQVTVAFVDYSKQSAIERTIRDVFPFARFMIGSTGWAKGLAERPSGLAAVLAGKSPASTLLASPQTLGHARRSAESQTEGDAGGGQFLPGEVAGTLALPLPWRDAEGNRQFLTSLGLPHEAVAQIVGGVIGLDAARKNLLGGLQPVIRLPAEYVTGRSFFFGTDFGSYRKAPSYLEPVAQKIPGREGRPDTYEVPGTLNELVNATPVSGMTSMIDKFFDSRKSTVIKAFNLTTGVKVSSVDLEREVKRRVTAYLKDKVASGQIGEVDAFFERGDPESIPEDLKMMLAAIAQERADAKKASKNAVRRGLGY